jgi:Fur family zinc uptake transcriptional regulator
MLAFLTVLGGLMVTAFPAADHDHEHCRSQALQDADTLCKGRGLRLTEARRRVLELLWADHCPVSAYEILDRLNEQLREADPHAKLLAPPAVYRALDFLMSHGFAHKLTSLNAYVGCSHPGRDHGAQFYICRSCRAVAEVRADAISEQINQAAVGLGFQVQSRWVEVEGLCAACQAPAGGHSR